jgi:hypothetical protein
MRTREEAVQQFVYHPATAQSALQHSKVRDHFVATVHILWGLIPDGPEKTLTMRKLQEAAMYANLAIALGAPADVSETRSVARVLPSTQVDTFGIHVYRGDTEIAHLGELGGRMDTLDCMDRCDGDCS